MGELSKADAERKRSNYISKITKIKRNVREDFEEMDFENANERTMMENCIEGMESIYNSLIGMLAGMNFE